MSIQQRSLAKRLNRYDDVRKLKKRKRSIQYLSSQKNSSSQWSDVAIDTWRKTSIRSLLMRTAFWSTSHKAMIAWSKMKYSIDSQFSRMKQLTDLSFEYDRWCIRRQRSFFFNTNLNDENIKRWETWWISISRSQRTCCVKSTWRVSEASFVEKRFSLKISWSRSRYSIFASCSMINSSIWTYIQSECSTSCVCHALAFRESLCARETSSTFMSWYEKNFDIDINEVEIRCYFLSIDWLFEFDVLQLIAAWVSSHSLQICWYVQSE